MFEKISYHCPNCSAIFRDDLEEKTVVSCMSCDTRWNVMFDKNTGKAALIEEKKREIPEPLWLPRGSIRAMTTIVISFSCWAYLFAGKVPPDFLIGLALTIFGYYFGFRIKVKGAESRIHDASAVEEEPLFLPAGFIRGFLVIGFLASGVFLYFRGKLSDASYLGFFVIIVGLVAGYIFSRVFAGLRGSALYNLLQHLKGILVLCSTALLVAILIRGGHAESPGIAFVLSTIISFYFGSRS